MNGDIVGANDGQNPRDENQNHLLRCWTYSFADRHMGIQASTRDSSKVKVKLIYAVL